MDLYSLMNSWTNFRLEKEKEIVKESRQKRLIERREVLNELSREAATKIMAWWEENKDNLSFDDVFKGQLRIVVPLETEDSKNLRKLMNAFIDHDYNLPGQEGTNRAFDIKLVRHVDTELGGGERSYEKPIAKLELEKETTKIIPAGPKKGQEITRKQKLSVSKLVAKHSRKGKDLIPRIANLKAWWEKRQQYYTKDENWKEIESIFFGEYVRQHIVLTRHPMDVLRMSDIDEIESCHSEGQSYFKCAMHEAQGHGPIAYLVDATDLEIYMHNAVKKKEKEGDGDILYPVDDDFYDYDLIDDEDDEPPRDYGTVRDQILKIKDKFINPKNLTSFKQAGGEARYNQRKRQLVRFSRLWADNYRKMEFRRKMQHLWSDVMKVDVDILIKAMENYFQSRPLHKDIPGYEPEEHYSQEDLTKMIGTLGEQEIFRDPERGVQGIGAKSRVRLRKYEDVENGVQFTVPEQRTYGPHPPGFRKAVLKWAWESQKDLFERENVKDWLPDIGDIQRYGGSYEDTYDGLLLHDFFENSKDFFDLDVDYLSRMNVRRIGQMDRSWELQTLIRQVDEITHQFNMEYGSSPGRTRPGMWLTARVQDESEYYQHHDTEDEDAPLHVKILCEAKMTILYDMPTEEDKPKAADEFVTPPTKRWPDEAHEFRTILFNAATNFSIPYQDAEWEVKKRESVDVLRITYTLAPDADELFTELDQFEYFVGELEQTMNDEAEVYNQYKEHLRGVLRDAHVLAASHFRAFAKSFYKLEDELENLAIDGITFVDEDDFEIDDDSIEVYLSESKLLYTLPENVLRFLVENPQIVRDMFKGAKVKRWPMHDYGAVEDRYYYIKSAAGTGLSSWYSILINDVIVNDLEKYVTKEKQRNKDSEFHNKKYDSHHFRRFLHDLTKFKYAFRMGPIRSKSEIDVYWEMSFDTKHAKEYLEAVRPLIKFIDKKVDKINEIIAKAVKHSFETYVEGLKLANQASEEPETEQ